MRRMVPTFATDAGTGAERGTPELGGAVAPEEAQAILRNAGFANTSLCHTGVVFRGWLGSA